MVRAMVRQMSFAIFAASNVALATPPEGYHPVIFAGPLLGQALEFKNDNGYTCNTGGVYKQYWLGKDMPTSGGGLITHPTFLNCLFTDLQLAGFSKENISIATPGVDVRTIPGHTSLTMFAGDILPALLAEGYEEDVSVASHTYDWRLGANDWKHTTFFEFKKLIEELVGKAGGSPAVLTGISMAGPYTHAFLAWIRKEDKLWAKKFVHAFVPIGGPFNGAVMALMGTVSSVLGTFKTEGDCPNCKPFPQPIAPMKNESNIFNDLIAQFAGGISEYLDDIASESAWSWPVMYWMSTSVDYSENPPKDRKVIRMANGRIAAECLSESSSRCGDSFTREGWYFDDPNYTNATQCAECYKVSSGTACKAGFGVADDNWVTDLCCKKHTCHMEDYRSSELPELMHKFGRFDSERMMNFASDSHTTSDPGVPVHCIHGYNIKTHAYLQYQHQDATGPTDVRITLDDGDQTVDIHSLDVCSRWPSTVKVYKVPGLKHSGALQCDDVVDVVKAIAINDDAAWKAWKEPAYKDVRAKNGSVVSLEDLFDRPPTFIESAYLSVANVHSRVRSAVWPSAGQAVRQLVV